MHVYSTPTRLTVFITNLPNKIRTQALEVKGPKEGVSDNIVKSIANSKNIPISQLYKKKLCSNKKYERKYIKYN